MYYVNSVDISKEEICTIFPPSIKHLLVSILLYIA